MSQMQITYENSIHLTAVDVVADYSVRITFSDGVTSVIDLRRRFVHPGGKLLGSPADFAKVRLDVKSDSLVWDSVDFHEHGESLYEDATSRSPA